MNELPGTPLHADPPSSEPPPQTGTDTAKGERGDKKVEPQKED